MHAVAAGQDRKRVGSRGRIADGGSNNRYAEECSAAHFGTVASMRLTPHLPG
jgi:hypothetical protein